MRSAAIQANDLLTKARAQVSDGSSQLETAERRVTELTESAKQHAVVVEQQLADLGNRSARTSAKLDSLAQLVKTESASTYLQNFIAKPGDEGTKNIALFLAKVRALKGNVVAATASDAVTWLFNPRTNPEQLVAIARELGWSERG